MSEAQNSQNVNHDSVNREAFPQATQVSSTNNQYLSDILLNGANSSSDWEAEIDFYGKLYDINHINEPEEDSKNQTRENAIGTSNEKQEVSGGKTGFDGNDATIENLNEKIKRGRENQYYEEEREEEEEEDEEEELAKKRKISGGVSEIDDSTNHICRDSCSINIESEDLENVMKLFIRKTKDRDKISSEIAPLQKHLIPCLIRHFRSIYKKPNRIKMTKSNFQEHWIINHCRVFQPKVLKKLNEIPRENGKFKSYDSRYLKWLFKSIYMRAAFDCYIELVFKGNNYSQLGLIYNFSCCNSQNHCEGCGAKWRKFKEILKKDFAGDQVVEEFLSLVHDPSNLFALADIDALIETS